MMRPEGASFIRKGINMNKELTEEEALALALGKSIIGGMRDAGMAVKPPVQAPPAQTQFDSASLGSRPIFG